MPGTLHISSNIYSNLYNKPHNTHYITVVCFVFGKPSMRRVVIIIVVI